MVCVVSYLVKVKVKDRDKDGGDTHTWMPQWKRSGRRVTRHVSMPINNHDCLPDQLRPRKRKTDCLQFLCSQPKTVGRPVGFDSS